MAEFLSLDQNAYTNRDRLLPSQPLMRQFFVDSYSDDLTIDAIERVTNSVLPIKSVHDKFDIQLKPGMSYETLGSDLSTLHFLQLLVHLTGAKWVLEIGTYIGVSAMFLANAGARVVTIEIGEEFGDIACENFIRNGLKDRISCTHLDAQKFCNGAVPESWDMIFLDGDKAHYGDLLQPVLDLLQPSGLLIVDDVFCQGDTLNFEPTTDKGRGVRDMLERVKALGPAYSPVILPYGDGLLLLRKPG